ncbi:hypothetical protein MMC28_003957 [Mycoblastus sanguinarius]|nr:hypothetical protein [Mycoblastus sanguinarius]
MARFSMKIKCIWDWLSSSPSSAHTPQAKPTPPTCSPSPARPPATAGPPSPAESTPPSGPLPTTETLPPPTLGPSEPNIKTPIPELWLSPENIKRGSPPTSSPLQRETSTFFRPAVLSMKHITPSIAPPAMTDRNPNFPSIRRGIYRDLSASQGQLGQTYGAKDSFWEAYHSSWEAEGNFWEAKEASWRLKDSLRLNLGSNFDTQGTTTDFRQHRFRNPPNTGRQTYRPVIDTFSAAGEDTSGLFDSLALYF